LFGALTVTKPANEELTATEENLMNDLGRQAGLALRNVRLTTELRSRLEELRASRQRIVAAGDEERRRLERNLHDGAQQELVAVKVQLAIAEDMADELEGDTAPLLELLERLKGQTGEALENLRDLARGIYPPLLAAEGLRVALSAQVRKASVEIELDADVGRFNQELEAAVYFCCLEAFQNIAKYAGPCNVTATIREVDEGVEFIVEDTGCGFDRSQVEAGMGGRNMADRLEALDGTIEIDSSIGHGTRVRGWIPLELAAAPVELP
jgi:signal transduction histidine kinase